MCHRIQPGQRHFVAGLEGTAENADCLPPFLLLYTLLGCPVSALPYLVRQHRPAPSVGQRRRIQARAHRNRLESMTMSLDDRNEICKTK